MKSELAGKAIIAIAGVALGIMLAFLSNVIDSHHSNIARQAEMRALAEVKRQCDSPFPLLLDGKFYTCKYMRDFHER